MPSRMLVPSRYLLGVAGVWLVLGVSPSAASSSQAYEGRSVHPQRQSPAPRTLRDMPPFPLSVQEDDIVANIIWGLGRTRMDKELESALRTGGAVAKRVLYVESELTPAHYFIVEIDTPAGIPFRNVIVSRDGWLWSIGQLAKGRQAPLRKLSDAANRLTSKFGPIARTSYYHAGNNLERGGSLYLPLIKAETPSGVVFLTSNGDIYVEDSFEVYQGRREEATVNLEAKRPGQQWLVKKTGIGSVRKIGALNPGK